MGRLWCRTDPTFKLGESVYHIGIMIPQTERDSVESVDIFIGSPNPQAIRVPNAQPRFRGEPIEISYGDASDFVVNVAVGAEDDATYPVRVAVTRGNTVVLYGEGTANDVVTAEEL